MPRFERLAAANAKRRTGYAAGFLLLVPASSRRGSGARPNR